ncbi:MAG: polyhydroxyalkanoate depolymerase [Reyranella sp.]|uniref:polyhydroxyalkanoate depolymerase n=1 Tax=Reyranella sp. TaxID=1929291 RepID=UPI001222AA61|nr:polyhydroxyalkanoate depolymerase [Reyranella sp.]TAJ42383.1 MAG: polyhydroxyalkanoate depolymerase [Reyranella sp.]
MLYHAYEFQRQLANPVRLWANALEQAYSSPYNPLSDTWLGKSVAAGAEIVARLTQNYGKPHFGLATTEIGNQTVEVNEEILVRKPFCDLVRFRRDTIRRDPKVLVVAPMSGHFATLLRGTVEALLPDHDVHITDWKDAREVPITSGDFSLDDYIDYVIAFSRYLGPDVHVIAVCQPSVPVLAAAALMAEAKDPRQPKSLTLMGGPIDTRQSPTVPNDLAMRNSMMWFRQNVISTVPFGYPGAMRRVYPGFLQLTSFISMNLDRHVNAHMRQFEHLVKGDDDSADGHRTFYDEYLAVMDLNAEFYLQTIEVVFKEHLLPRGEWVSRGRKIDPSFIETALMTVEGELDDISGIGQTKAAHALTPNIPGARHVHWEQPRVGHYGIFNGRKWREQIMPRVRTFIRENDAA